MNDRSTVSLLKVKQVPHPMMPNSPMVQIEAVAGDTGEEIPILLSNTQAGILADSLAGLSEGAEE